VEAYINYEGDRRTFSLPKAWRVISQTDKPTVPGVADPVQEIRRALDNPIGSPRIEETARPGMEVVLLFDDLQRPTPANLALPEIMNRLNRAGVPDERISGVCALGTHPVLTLEQLNQRWERKLSLASKVASFVTILAPRTTSSSERPTGEFSWK
jgi:nickel-dependent lactate racemase